MASSGKLGYLTNITTIIKYCKVYEIKKLPLSGKRQSRGGLSISTHRLPKGFRSGCNLDDKMSNFLI